MDLTKYPYYDEKSLKLAKKRFALIDWATEQLNFAKKITSAFNPCKKDENYANWQIKEYLRYSQMKAVLEDSISVLENSKSTQQMYDNVEYTLCKLYDIKYLEELEVYA